MAVSALDITLVLVAGFGAGTINALIGSGTLLTFPVLLAVGYSPVVANASNTLGLVPGAISAALGYRKQLRGTRARLLRFAPATILGAVAGAILFVTLPDRAFDAIVPALIGLALLLVLLQPAITRWAGERCRGARAQGGPLLRAGILGTGVYGGYFGAGQGILLFGLLAAALPGDLREINAIRTVLAGIANAVAALVFILIAEIAWLPVLLIALGATAGGSLGAVIGRRLPDRALRGVIVVIGLTAIVLLVP